MGYSYGYTSSGRMGLACDSCGTVGGVRKRPCPHKVTDADGTTLPYCPPPAYCDACYKERGGLRGVHGDRCRDGAATMQAREDATRARLAAGEWQVRTAWGDWHEKVPEGMTGVRFVNAAGDETYRYIPKDDYDPGRKPWLSDYPTATPALALS